MATKIRTDHWVCWGCTREGVVYSAAGYICPVWADQSKVFMIRQGECIFNKRGTDKIQKKLNALKASKRAARGR